MADLASTMRHNPSVSLSDSSGEGMINKVSTTVYTDGGAGQASEPCRFECSRKLQFAVSVFPVDGAGVQKTGTNFSVGLYRSLDQGVSWQLFATYTAAAEVFISCAMDFPQWQFRLLDKTGGDNIRVRART